MKKWLIIIGVLLIVGLAAFFIVKKYKAKKELENLNSQYASASGYGIGDMNTSSDGSVTVTGVRNAPTAPTAANFSKVAAHFGSLTTFPEFGSKKSVVKKAGKTYCGKAKEFKNLSGFTGNRYKRRREACLTPFMQVYSYKCDSDCDSE